MNEATPKQRLDYVLEIVDDMTELLGRIKYLHTEYGHDDFFGDAAISLLVPIARGMQIIMTSEACSTPDDVENGGPDAA